MSELRKTISDQAEELKKRAEWLQKMLERQTEATLKAQSTAEQIRLQLQVTNSTLDVLRAEYRKIEGNNNGSKE